MFHKHISCYVFTKPYNPPLPSKHWSLKVQRAVKTSGVKVPKANNLRTETGFSFARKMVPQVNWIIPNVEPIYHLCLHTARHSGSRMIDPPPKKKMHDWNSKKTLKSSHICVPLTTLPINFDVHWEVFVE